MDKCFFKFCAVSADQASFNVGALSICSHMAGCATVSADQASFNVGAWEYNENKAQHPSVSRSG